MVVAAAVKVRPGPLTLAVVADAGWEELARDVAEARMLTLSAEVEPLVHITIACRIRLAAEDSGTSTAAAEDLPQLQVRACIREVELD